MKQYGIKITIDDSNILEVYHHSLSYIDWAVYSSSDEMYDSSTIRYLIRTYVERVIKNNKDINPLELLSENAHIQQKIINNIFEKSIFHDEDKFVKLINELDVKSKTLVGCYDLFIFQQMGPEFYLQLIDQDAYTRAQIIMMVEKSTGINVKNRFDEAIRLKIPLDLINNQEQYLKNMRKHGGPVPPNPPRRNPLNQHNQVMENLDKHVPQDKRPKNVDVMIESAQMSLREALNKGRRNNNPQGRPTFNWQQDEQSFNQNLDS